MRTTTRLSMSTSATRYGLPGNLGRLLFIWSPTDKRFLTRVPDRHLLDKHFGFAGASVSGLYGGFELLDRTLVLEAPWPIVEDLYVGYFRTPARLVNAQDVSNLPYPHAQLHVWDALIDLKSYAKELEAVQVWVAKQRACESSLYSAFCEGQTLGGVPLTIHPPTDDEHSL
jgi:hypothetical protein